MSSTAADRLFGNEEKGLAPSKPLVARRVVPYEQASKFIRHCRAHPERMRVLCSTKANREGGDAMVVVVEVAQGGPMVEVHEISMAEGWTGCRFSPAALWLSLSLAAHHGSWPTTGIRGTALELGCGVGLAGLTAHALGFSTTLTDCLEGQLRSLGEHAAAIATARAAPNALGAACAIEAGTAELQVRRLDWIEEVGLTGGAAVDDHAKGSPENVAASGLGKVDASVAQRLIEREWRSFDLVLASDVLYEEHHTSVLPRVVERFLRPGGTWAMSFAIRDEEMLFKFLMQMRSCGLLAAAPASASDAVDAAAGAGEVPERWHVAWETACIADKCPFCSKLQEHPTYSWCAKRHDRDCCGARCFVVGAPAVAVPLAFLKEVIDAHEGGAVTFEGRRPAVY